MTSGRRVLDSVEDSVEDGLLKVAQAVVVSSERKLPIGDPELDPDPAVSLQGSAEITRVDDNVVMIKYPGPYAARQHEDRTMQHPRGGQAQFLGDALKEVLPRFAGIVAGEVRAQVKRKH